MASAARVRDVIVLGGGHNGLVCAAYLARSGLDVTVVERREMVGGCAVTETVDVDGLGPFKLSRASYLAGLLRPHIVNELGLVSKHGLRLFARDPYSFTPTDCGSGLVLEADPDRTRRSIAQFSARDADAFARYEAWLGTARDAIVPLLDGAPPNPFDATQTWSERIAGLGRAGRALASLRSAGPGAAREVARLLVSPARTLLDAVSLCEGSFRSILPIH